MKNSKKMEWEGCPIRDSAALIGDKWGLLLIRDLMFKGRRHFGNFLEDDGESISTNILTDRLNRLLDIGIVDKTRDVNDGKKFVYTLTQKGRDLLPLMVEMLKWAQKYDDNTFLSQEFVDGLNKSPKQYQRQVLKELKAVDEEALKLRD